MKMTDRIRRLREQSLNAVNRITAERALLITEFYKSGVAASEPVPVQRALSFKYILEHRRQRPLPLTPKSASTLSRTSRYSTTGQRSPSSPTRKHGLHTATSSYPSGKASPTGTASSAHCHRNGRMPTMPDYSPSSRNNELQDTPHSASRCSILDCSN